MEYNLHFWYINDEGETVRGNLDLTQAELIEFISNDDIEWE